MAKRKNKENKVKQCTIFVDGMHCASCEVLIEKKLLQQEGIDSADASLKGHRVVVNYVGDKRPDPELLNKEFEELGYEFSTKKFDINDNPAISIVNGQIRFEPSKMKDLLRVIVVVIFLLGAFFIMENLELGRYVSVDSTSSLPAFFLLGLVAGLSSCAALVGGLLLSMIKQWNELYITAETPVEKAQPHFMFHIGRILSFTIFGGLLGLIGDVISFDDARIFPILTIVISVVMFLLALQMLGVEWAQRFKFTAPKSLTRYVANEQNFQGKLMPFLIGTLTFVLPCGFTLIAQTIALTSGSFMQGALIMLMFALGTFPILLGISFSGLKFNSKPQLTQKFNIIAGLVILFFVVYNVNGQLNVLGVPSLSDISFDSTTETEAVLETSSDGVQELQIIAAGFQYIPNSSMTIKAGIPTKLIVDNQGIQGCGTFMAAQGLINNFVPLEPGINEIDLGTPSAGTYKLTCSMGMVPPVTISVL